MTKNKRLGVVAGTAAAMVAAGAIGISMAGSANAASTVSGYASVGSSTTGGTGGTTVTVTTLSALKTEAAKSDARIIKISGTISGAEAVTVKGDKTILGVGSSATLSGVGLKIKGVSNVIVQNLNITKVKAAAGDAIHIEDADHIWIDHNTLSSDMNNGKDYYDGLIDMSHGADYITVSYNYLHDHYKAMLIGHSDSNSSEDTGTLHVTIHHNYFENINSRVPSIRFGTAHIYNNYYVNVSSGVHSRMGAQTLVQNNVFVDCGTALTTTGDSTEDGYTNASGNDYGDAEVEITQTGSMSSSSLPYTASVGKASSTAAYVTANAGAGNL